MQDDLLPLFPLSAVLLPGAELPLHVFEERYKEMVNAVLSEHSEFGVVLAVKDGIASVGCTASIDEILKQYPDGRLDIITTGQRRFLIESLDAEKSYLRAKVVWLDDVDTSSTHDLRERALAACAPLLAADPPASDFDPDSPFLSFQLARSITDLAFRQELLMTRSEAGRLQRLVDFVPGYAVRLEQITRLREVAPRNGHSHLPVPSAND